MKWRRLISNWNKIEEKFLKEPYKIGGWLLSTKIWVISFIFLGLAVGKLTLMYFFTVTITEIKCI